MKAGIELLKSEISRIDVWPRTGRELYLKSYRQALAILEAAEKVDKKLCLEFITEFEFFLVKKDKRDADFIRANKQIRALLESLPDKE